ncbi:MAG: CYTH domain-containing protein [Flavobacteriaceae bacterium]|nr:CYTH domain-containing protein [Flavobacteriaceae bacterium]CAI8291586.1 MAG: Inorganic triphosphatase [Flavobacteriaceae bacterium]
MIEIERKFLVKSSEYKTLAFKVEVFTQAYISKNPARSVRIRIVKNEGFLTIKGISKNKGTTRFEWEKKLPIDEALELMKLCEDEVILKNRYFIKHDEVVIEVDEFLKKNQGLVIAEIELKSVDQKLRLPSWIGKEITGENKYYNLSLIDSPFISW